MLNVSDVTGKRAAQNQALQSQKVEAIGEFAAGISHDFTNLLTAIQGYVEVALDAAPADSALRADLTQALASTDRATAVRRRAGDGGSAQLQIRNRTAREQAQPTDPLRGPIRCRWADRAVEPPAPDGLVALLAGGTFEVVGPIVRPSDAAAPDSVSNGAAC